MTTEETVQSHDRQIDALIAQQAAVSKDIGRLAKIVEQLDESVSQHDRHIAQLFDLAEESIRSTDAIKALHAETERRFQAYLTTIHPRQ